MNAPITLSVSHSAIEALFSAIYRLRDTAPLDDVTAQNLRERARQAPQEKRPTGDFLKRANGDTLLSQVLRIEAELDRWFEAGETPSTYPVNQATHLLRQAGKAELERAFVAVWRLHFQFGRSIEPAIDVHEVTVPQLPPEAVAAEPAPATGNAGLQAGSPPPSTGPTVPPFISSEVLSSTRPVSDVPQESVDHQDTTDINPADLHAAVEAGLFDESTDAFEISPAGQDGERADPGADSVAVDASGVLGVLSGTHAPLTPGMPNGSNEISDYWRVPPVILMALGGVPPTNIALVPIQGDSMVPSLLDGDVAVIDTRHRLPSPDGLYALNDAFGGIVVKRLEIVSNPDDKFPRVQVISDNPKYVPRHLYLDEIQVVGRVLRKFGHVS